MTFEAKYPGHCVACDGPIKRGQMAQYQTPYSTSRDLVHVICPEVAPEVARPVCPRCFLELPLSGACGNCE